MYSVVLQGHFQVMFSKAHCPLLQRKLSFFMKVRIVTSLSAAMQLFSFLRMRAQGTPWAAFLLAASSAGVYMGVAAHGSSVGGVQILFCSGVWSYVVASIATPTFILVPLLTIWFGIFPIVLSWWAALGLSIYYIATCGVSAPTLFLLLTRPFFGCLPAIEQRIACVRLLVRTSTMMRALPGMESKSAHFGNC